MPGTILSVNYDENDHLVVLIDPTRQIGDKNLYADQGFNKRERNQQKKILVLLCIFFGMKPNYFLLIFCLYYNIDMHLVNKKSRKNDSSARI